MRNRPMPAIKRTNKMREERRELSSNDFHVYIMREDIARATVERVLIGRFVDDEQIEKVYDEMDF